MDKAKKLYNDVHYVLLGLLEYAELSPVEKDLILKCFVEVVGESKKKDKPYHRTKRKERARRSLSARVNRSLMGIEEFVELSKWRRADVFHHVFDTLIGDNEDKDCDKDREDKSRAKYLLSSKVYHALNRLKEFECLHVPEQEKISSQVFDMLTGGPNTQSEAEKAWDEFRQSIRDHLGPDDINWRKCNLEQAVTHLHEKGYGFRLYEETNSRWDNKE